MKSVLIIDDDEVCRYLAREIVHRSGQFDEILDAHNAKDALGIIKTLKKGSGTKFMPDLLLLDLNMPRMDGFDFIEELKDLCTDKNSMPYIVILTANYTPDDAVRVKEDEYICGILEKPVDVQKIIDIVNSDSYKNN